MRTLSILVFASVSASPAIGQAVEGDLLVAGTGASMEAVRHLNSGGATQVSIPLRIGDTCIGTALHPSGGWVTVSTNPAHPNTSRVDVFDPSGGPSVASFQTLVSVPTDVAVFSNGHIVVADYSGRVVVHDAAGLQLSSISHFYQINAGGICIDSHDYLWVADPGSGFVFKFDESHSFEHFISGAVDPRDVSSIGDDTVWVIDRASDKVVHLSHSSVPLDSFDTGAAELNGIASSRDGTLWYSQAGVATLSNVDTSGSLIASVPIAAGFEPGLLEVVEGAPLDLEHVFCSADTGAVACPCGNTGASGTGCANSTSSGGVLSLSGTTSVSYADMILQAKQLPANVSALLFTGTTRIGAGAGLPFGDGLRCIGGGLRRVSLQTTSFTGHAFWELADYANQGWNAGDQVLMQVWYRDPQGGPCGSNSNSTNAMALNMIP
jgi:hypothetical protein